MLSEQLTEIYQLLFDRFGPQHWWPGETQFEIITGAILTQNTSWSNVEKSIANLKSANLLTPEKLYRLDTSELAELIRPAGYYNIKAKRLKSFLNWLFQNYDGRLENLEGLDTEQLRAELLAIKGIGRETADSILLYAFDRPIFVVDAYTARVAVRHGLISADADYEQLRELFQSNLPHAPTLCFACPRVSRRESGQRAKRSSGVQKPQLFNEFHALLVRLGKDFCRPNADCPGCPLEKLPHCLDIQ
jgi:endonuclease-3 related protein